MAQIDRTGLVLWYPGERWNPQSRRVQGKTLLPRSYSFSSADPYENNRILFHSTTLLLHIWLEETTERYSRLDDSNFELYSTV